MKLMTERFMAEGSMESIEDLLTPFEEFNRFVGLQDAVERERRLGT